VTERYGGPGLPGSNCPRRSRGGSSSK